MPGYVIHLAVAKEYLNKNKEINENEFIEGVIYPDSVKDKSLTHYGKGSSYTNLFKFLTHKDINTIFNRGYFLHLLTDYLFYNRYIDTFSKDIYNDYDLLNRKLIEKYDLKIPDKIKDSVFFKKEGELKILSMEIIDNLVRDISIMNINELAKEILKDPEKWTKIRELKRI